MTSVHQDFRLDRFRGAVGVCGVRSDLQGARYGGDACRSRRLRLARGRHSMAFQGNGWMEGPAAVRTSSRPLWIPACTCGTTTPPRSPLAPPPSWPTSSVDVYTVGGSGISSACRSTREPVSQLPRRRGNPDPARALAPKSPWMLDDAGVDLPPHSTRPTPRRRPSRARTQRMADPASRQPSRPLAGGAPRAAWTSPCASNPPTAKASTILLLLLWVQAAMAGQGGRPRAPTVGGVSGSEALGRNAVVYDWTPSWNQQHRRRPLLHPADRLPDSLRFRRSSCNAS